MSAAPDIQENIKLNQQWDTVSVPITLQDNNWGISRELNEPIIQLVESLGLYTDTSGNRVFGINVLKVLVRYMHQQKMDMSNLSAAVGKLMVDHQRQLTLETQRVLNSFISGIPEDMISLDGVWNEACEMMLEQIASDYHLADRSPSPKLLQQLKTISSRLIKANLKETLPQTHFGGNFFFIIYSEEKELVLVFNNEDDSSLYLTDVEDDRKLVKIDWRRSWRADDGNGPFSRGFEKFSKWLMLLMMEGKGEHHTYVDLQIQKNGAPPTTIEDFYDPAMGWDFVVKVGYLLNFPDQHQSVPIQFFPKPGNDINVIAVLFSETFDVAITQGYRTGEQPENGTAAVIDFEYFFRKMEPDEPVQGLHKSNFLKLFIVRGSFGRKADQNNSADSSFTIDPSDIIALLKADEKDILATLNIGLNFDSKPSFGANSLA